MDDRDGPEQLELVPSTGHANRRATPKPKVRKPEKPSAPEFPVARVAVDNSLAHLDRLFDYTIPLSLHEAAVPGCRLKVRFAGKIVDGFLVDRGQDSMHPGKLAAVLKVVSSEPVLHPQVLAAAGKVADRYAGTLADVIRLAFPPRHARTEKQRSPDVELAPLNDVDGVPWRPYERGEAFVAALVDGESPRACWSALPGAEPVEAVASAVLATLHSGRGALVCVPDVRDVARFDEVFARVLGPGRHVTLTSAQSASERYRAFLALSRGIVNVVIGTRAAAFAPVGNLGIVAMFDDGDDLFAEQRAPYPHAREVLLTRALVEDSAVLIGGFARSSEAQMLIETGWCQDLAPAQSLRRVSWPRVEVCDGSDAGSAPARLPGRVFTMMREALESGPVLMQVPRRGYRTSLACQQCRTQATCAACQGPLIQARAGAPPRCRWCAMTNDRWMCGNCGGVRLRAPVVGQLRTAEEIAKAFSGVQVITSSGDSIRERVGTEPAIILATPGAEPVAEGGYRAGVLLDTWLQLGRPEMRVDEEAHRRWFNALALVRSASDGGRAIVIGDPARLQALVRTDPVGYARREVAERRDAHLPPSTRLATIEGPVEALAALDGISWPQPCEALGPVPLGPATHGPATHDDDRGRLIVRVPREHGMALAVQLAELQAERSAAKSTPLRIQVDPIDL